VRLAGQYRVGYDEKADAMTVTALQDVATSGANAAGIKVVHLRGRTFANPVSGHCPVTVSQVAAEGSVKVRWHGRFEVADSAPEARLTPTNFLCRQARMPISGSSNRRRLRRSRSTCCSGVPGVRR